MFHKQKKGIQRTPEQIKEQYEIEKKFADKLKNASIDERHSLYTTLYDEFFRLVPHHPMLRIKKSPQLAQQIVNQNIKLINRFLSHVKTFMDVGSGDCALSLRMAEQVQKVYAVDVSTVITKNVIGPTNFQLCISDGFGMPVPHNTIDLAYSRCLMEHLHPHDAYLQLKNIYTALSNTGKYICITPNRISGPHDISKYFDDVATGFHLKEYTIEELSNLFREVGFTKVILYAGGKGIYIRFPLQLGLISEKILSKMPCKLRKTVTNFLPIKAILGINLIGLK